LAVVVTFILLLFIRRSYRITAKATGATKDSRRQKYKGGKRITEDSKHEIEQPKTKYKSNQRPRETKERLGTQEKSIQRRNTKKTKNLGDKVAAKD